MSLYNQEFNKDNVVLRYIIVATLAELKSQLYYYNLVDDKRVKINIPFYYSTTGEERFLQDNFLYDTVDQGKAIGDYELVPRGVLQMQGFSINTDELTNKYSTANYTILCKDGLVRTLKADTNFIPITMNFDVTIVLTNMLEILKVSEALVSKLYKTKLFYVDLGMCTMQSSISIPEDFSEEKPFEFQVDTKKEYQITFSIEVKSFIPVFPKGISFNHIADMIDKFVEKHPKDTDVLTLVSESRSSNSDNNPYNPNSFSDNDEVHGSSDSSKWDGEEKRDMYGRIIPKEGAVYVLEAGNTIVKVKYENGYYWIYSESEWKQTDKFTFDNIMSEGAHSEKHSSGNEDENSQGGGQSGDDSDSGEGGGSGGSGGQGGDSDSRAGKNKLNSSSYDEFNGFGIRSGGIIESFYFNDHMTVGLNKENEKVTFTEVSIVS